MADIVPAQAARFRDLHYLKYGDGRPVIALHGFGQTSYSWRCLAAQLPPNFTLYAFDLRGCGESARPHDDRYTLRDQADLICAFIEEHDLKGVTLIGHSMGGGIALLVTLKLLAQRGRLEALVLLDSLALPQRIPWFIQIAKIPVLGPLAMACAPPRLLYRIIMYQAYDDPGLIDADAVAAYARNIATAEGRFALHKMARFIVPDDIDRIIASYRSIDIPTLIIWGSNDRIIPVKKGAALHAAIPGSRLVTLDNCGHIPHEEKPHEAVPLVCEFLIKTAS